MNVKLTEAREERVSFTKIGQSFREDLNRWIEVAGPIHENSSDLIKISSEMENKGRSLMDPDKVTASKYFYLGSLGYLLIYLRTLQPTLKKSLKLIRTALTLDSTSEYRLIEILISILQCESAEDLAEKLNGVGWCFIIGNGSIFNEEWLKSLFEVCVFRAIISRQHDIENSVYPLNTLQPQVGTIRTEKEYLNELWKTTLRFSNPHFRMVGSVMTYISENPFRYIYNRENKEEKRLKDICALEGYDISDCDVKGNIFHNRWALAYVYYAIFLLSDKIVGTTDIERGLEMLERATELDDCRARNLACNRLGVCYENGKFIKQDLDKALEYFSKNPLKFRMDIRRVQKKILKLERKPNLLRKMLKYLGYKHGNPGPEGEYRNCVDTDAERSAEANVWRIVRI